MKKLIWILLGLMCVGFAVTFAQMTSSEGVDSVQVIDDVNKYSNISVSELKNLMGKPECADKWTNKTSKGNFKVVTYEYSNDTRHYEFIAANGKIVRVTIYSGDSWNSDGNAFEYNGNEESILDLFSVKPGNSARKKYNGASCVITNVNDKIKKFDVQDMDNDKKTFGFVKVTYNMDYFD